MLKAHALVFALAAFVLARPALAQQDTELGRLREEMKALQKQYEDRMQALEKRLSDAEARAGKAEQSAGKAEQSANQAETAAVAAGRRPAGENAFNPAISLILQGTYARTSADPNNFAITGFVPSGGEVGPPKRSFGLGESELFLTANVDPYFRGVAVLSFTPDNSVEVEEAYGQTLALPSGLTLKAGRFLSGIGYLNEIHQHAWDFQDAPLPYKAFLGGRLQQDGVQLRWVAPTPIFVELGGEIASGGPFPGSDQNKNGAGAWALLAHLGGDIGESTAWRAGVSYLHAGAKNRNYDDLNAAGVPVTNSFSGNTRALVVDGVIKWSPNGNSTITNFKLQGEYFRTRQRGDLTFNATGAGLTDFLRTDQSGWYTQAVYQFAPRWRVGYRFDALNRGTMDIGLVNTGVLPAADFPVLAEHHPTRNTAMLEFNPSEFSRFRLQLAADKSRVGVTDNQVFLQYIYSLGPHGAHRF
jgi:hypothetical protein